MEKKVSLLLLILLHICTGCKNPAGTDPAKPVIDNKSITSFSFEGLSPAVNGTIEGTVITVLVPEGTDVTALVATFKTTGNQVLIDDVIQNSGLTPNDFTNQIDYTVCAEDGSETTYTVGVDNPPKTITTFTFNGLAPAANGKIEGSTISVIVPDGTDVTALIATFSTTGTEVKVDDITQTSGVTPNDFSDPLDYTVVAEDGSENTYSVVVDNPHKSITSFSFESLSPAAVGTIEGSTITVIVPDGTDVTGLAATFITTGTSVNIGGIAQNSSVTANDFSSGMTYTVTAVDGSSRNYKVLVYYPVINLTELKQKISDGDDLTNVNTSDITDMSSLFQGMTDFNQNISKWDVSSVTTMQNMFQNCSIFNQDISIWNISSVMNMGAMFYNSYAFNQNLSSWSELIPESTYHENFSAGVSPLTTANHPYASWN